MHDAGILHIIATLAFAEAGDIDFLISGDQLLSTNEVYMVQDVKKEALILSETEIIPVTFRKSRCTMLMLYS